MEYSLCDSGTEKAGDTGLIGCLQLLQAGYAGEVELPGPDPAYALEVQKPQKILAGSIVDPFRQLLGLEGYAQIEVLGQLRQ